MNLRSLCQFVGVVAIGCGALLVVGLVTRLAAIPLVTDITVAILSTKAPILLAKGFWPMEAETRTDYAMLMGLLFLRVVGAGRWSVDAHRRSRKHTREEVASMRRRSGTHVRSRIGRAPRFPATLALLAAAACTHSARSPAATPYTPRTRELTVTSVPLLVKEARTVYPFLAADFARGGVLEGKEVYAFSPSTLTVVEGDTVHFTFVNPEDDEHWFYLPDCTEDNQESFVLPDCAVRLPAQTETYATYIARHAGVYPFMCTVVKHVPFMHGQLVVLSPAAVAGRAARGE